MGRRLLLAALLFVVLAYIFNPVVPDNYDEKWMYRLNGAIWKISHLVGVMYSKFAPGDSSVNYIHYKQAAVWLAFDHISTDDIGPGVSASVANFSGVRVYVYQPPKTSDELLPAFVFFHGGGLALLTARSFEGVSRKISSDLNAVVIAVDYDLAPSNKFPGPVMQCFEAMKWFLLHANEYGVDSGRIAVGGDSAGGYLSATVSQLIHDDIQVPNIKLQVLIYPWTQCLDFNFPSYQKYTYDHGEGGGIVSETAMQQFCALHAWGSARPDLMAKMRQNRHVGPTFKQSALYQETFGHHLLPAAYRDRSYYGEPAAVTEGDEDFWNENKHIFLDPRFTPHFRRNMTGLPTAYVITAGFDSLRDEGYLYAQQLKKAGVDVTLVHYEKAWHGVIWTLPFLRFAIGDRIKVDFLEFVQERL